MNFKKKLTMKHNNIINEITINVIIYQSFILNYINLDDCGHLFTNLELNSNST